MILKSQLWTILLLKGELTFDLLYKSDAKLS